MKDRAREESAPMRGGSRDSARPSHAWPCASEPVAQGKRSRGPQDESAEEVTTIGEDSAE